MSTVNSPSDAVARWDVAFAALEEEWQAVTLDRAPASVDVAAWEVALAEMETEYSSSFTQRRWVSGPADLLSVIGRHSDELTHSALVAWLLTPTGRHSLDRRVLDGMLELLWPELPRPTGPVFVDREVHREIPPIDDRPAVQARADVVVRAGNSVIVIENKIGSGEGPNQCWRLHEVWKSAEAGADVRWVLLSPHGGAPTTAGDSFGDWRKLSYRQLRSLITEAVAAADAEDVAENRQRLRRATVNQYLTTLDGINRPFESSGRRTGAGGHQDG